MVHAVFAEQFGLFVALPVVCGAGAVLPEAAEREPGISRSFDIG